MSTSSDQKARGRGGLNALCQYQQPPNLDLSRHGGMDGSSLVTTVGINRDFCCWQADVNQVRSGHGHQ